MLSDEVLQMLATMRPTGWLSDQLLKNITQPFLGIQIKLHSRKYCRLCLKTITLLKKSGGVADKDFWTSVLALEWYGLKMPCDEKASPCSAVLILAMWAKVCWAFIYTIYHQSLKWQVQTSRVLYMATKFTSYRSLNPMCNVASVFSEQVDKATLPELY